MHVSIRSGTHAGIKPPFNGKAPAWFCLPCDSMIPGYWSTCPACYSPRPRAH